MILRAIFDSNPYVTYKEFCDDKVFENIKDLFIQIAESFIASNPEADYDFQIIKNEIERIFTDHNSSFSRFYVPFIFSPRREEIITKIKMKHNLEETKVNDLRSIIFNFIFKSFIENKIGHGLIKDVFNYGEILNEGFHKHLNTLKSTFGRTKETFNDNQELVTQLENIHQKQIEEQKNIFFEKTPILRILNNNELGPVKNELLPELFKRGRPQTTAYNEFIFKLYELCSDQKTYMPLIMDVISELNNVNPDYFLRTEISESAVRKKIKEMKTKT